MSGGRIAVVTGASSGVGRGITLALAAEGWDVALVARGEPGLRQAIDLAGKPSGRLIAISCDVSNEQQVQAMADRVTGELGPPTALINAAGTNTSPRDLEHLSPAQFRGLIDVNLVGAFLCVRALLPAMRTAGRGTIVNIASDAGLLASAKAGAAYVSSKFGLVGFTQTINAEQRQHGIRACAVCPGDINTPLLDKRPIPPPPEARTAMLQPQDVAACVMLVLNLPERAVIEQLLIRPR